ncbi:MAG: hypothetical protein ACYSUI_11800 [Planctomycetota bacterium]|jgi:hypothetical protein
MSGEVRSEKGPVRRVDRDYSPKEIVESGHRPALLGSAAGVAATATSACIAATI